MASDIDKTIQENLNFYDGAGGQDSGRGPGLARFIKAVGTLAQVIYMITPNDHREQALEDPMRSLQM